MKHLQIVSFSLIFKVKHVFSQQSIHLPADSVCRHGLLSGRRPVLPGDRWHIESSSTVQNSRWFVTDLNLSWLVILSMLNSIDFL